MREGAIFISSVTNEALDHPFLVFLFHFQKRD